MGESMKRYQHLRIVERDENLAVLLLDSVIYDTEALELADELLELLDKHRPSELVVNLSCVEIGSSSFFNTLIRVKRRLQGYGGQLRLSQLRPEMYGKFEALNLIDTVFTFQESHVGEFAEA